jgi:hypothetical protein
LQGMQVTSIDKLVDEGVNAFVQRTEKTTKANIIEATIRIRNKAELSVILDGFNLEQVSVIIEVNPIIVVPSSNADNVSSFFLEGNNVRCAARSGCKE